MLNNLMNFVKNPISALMKSKLDIPQNFQGNANDMIQYLLDSGQITQDQYNMANQKAREITDNPQFKQIFGIK